MMRNIVALLLSVAFLIAFAGCVRVAPVDQDYTANVIPIPESWLKYPEAESLSHMSHEYEIDYQNIKVRTDSWVLFAPDDVPPDYEGWQMVIAHYDSLAEQRDDFIKDPYSEGIYIWGEYTVHVDGNTSQDDESRFEIWLKLEHFEPIDASLPQ